MLDRHACRVLRVEALRGEVVFVGRIPLLENRLQENVWQSLKPLFCPMLFILHHLLLFVPSASLQVKAVYPPATSRCLRIRLTRQANFSNNLYAIDGVLVLTSVVLFDGSQRRYWME